MFETAELGRKLTKDEFNAAAEQLRPELLTLQTDLEGKNFSVIVLINGVDGIGKGELLRRLHEWLDPRYLVTHALEASTEEERERPAYWRFWMWLPQQGQIGIFHGSWYTDPIVSRVYERIEDDRLDAELARINAFERTLSDNGTLFIKIWLHMSKDDQERRLKRLEKSRATRWRVSKLDWKHHERFDDFVDVSSRILRRTSTGYAPWTVIECSDERYRDVASARHIAERLKQRLADSVSDAPPEPGPAIEDPLTILDQLDLTLRVPDEEYEKELVILQGRLNKLSRHLEKRRKSAIVLFEGTDAAGKGGAIRRLTAALDPRHYRVIRVSAPTDEERAHHYLWRFWRHIPRKGKFTIYDRSWYGRVLVERVEGFATTTEYQRAYKEINDFEEDLADGEVILVKFWLHVSGDEQLKRFAERESLPWKQHKITADDYRNRAKGNQYELAASEMVERTSTEFAPWTLVEADDKRFARLKVLTALCEKLERGLKGE